MTCKLYHCCTKTMIMPYSTSFRDILRYRSLYWLNKTGANVFYGSSCDAFILAVLISLRNVAISSFHSKLHVQMVDINWWPIFLIRLAYEISIGLQVVNVDHVVQIYLIVKVGVDSTCNFCYFIVFVFLQYFFFQLLFCHRFHHFMNLKIIIKFLVICCCLSMYF